MACTDIIFAAEKIADHSFHTLTYREVNQIDEALRDAAEAVAHWQSSPSPALRFLTELQMHVRIRSAAAFREIERNGGVDPSEQEATQ